MRQVLLEEGTQILLLLLGVGGVPDKSVSVRKLMEARKLGLQAELRVYFVVS